jgi:hypothetical protein
MTLSAIGAAMNFDDASVAVIVVSRRLTRSEHFVFRQRVEMSEYKMLASGETAAHYEDSYGRVIEIHGSADGRQGYNY